MAPKVPCPEPHKQVNERSFTCYSPLSLEGPPGPLLQLPPRPTCQVRARAQGGQARPGRHWAPRPGPPRPLGPWGMPVPGTSGVAARPMDVPGEPQPARRGGRAAAGPPRRPSESEPGPPSHVPRDLAGRLLGPVAQPPRPLNPSPVERQKRNLPLFRRPRVADGTYPLSHRVLERRVPIKLQGSDRL